MADEANHAGHGEAGADAQRGVAATRVLVVDEDRVEGGMLAFHLRRENLVVMLAAGADEAIDALAWAPPDALLVEARGHELDGFTVVAALGDAPVKVFLMADGPLELEDELRALRLGVSDIFTKPLDPALVARRLYERSTVPRRGSIPDLPDSGISGELAIHSVTYLLSLCHRHRMNARLHIELDGDWGVMLVRHGEVIDAESPGATGRDAAFAAIRRARGTFVLFPLALDAEELSRDDVVRSDLATLFSDAHGRPEPRPVNAARAVEVHPLELEIQRVESPRGPLSRPVTRRGDLGSETLEYEASPVPRAGRPMGPDTRARIRRQVGLPVEEAAPEGRPAPAQRSGPTAPTATAAPAPSDTQEPALTSAPTPTPPGAAAPSPPGETIEHAHAKPLDRTGQRQRVTTGALVRERASQIRRPTRPLPVSSPPNDPIRPPAVLNNGSTAQEATTVAHGDAVTRDPTVVGLASAAPSPGVASDLTTTAQSGQAPPPLPVSARIVRPMTGPRLGTDAGFDEPTDVREKNPITTGARVRRPTTGLFRIGDPNAPAESTDVGVTAAGSYADLRGTRRPRPSGVVLVLAGVFAALLVFVVARVVTKGPSPQDATPVAERVAELDPRDRARIRFGEAAMAIGRGDDPTAERTLKTLVGESDRPDGALAALAALYIRQGRIDDAQPLLEVLARQRGEDGRVRAWLGLVLARQGRIDDARGHLEAARRTSDGLLGERIDQLLRLLE